MFTPLSCLFVIHNIKWSLLDPCALQKMGQPYFYNPAQRKMMGSRGTDFHEAEKPPPPPTPPKPPTPPSEDESDKKKKKNKFKVEERLPTPPPPPPPPHPRNVRIMETLDIVYARWLPNGVNKYYMLPAEQLAADKEAFYERKAERDAIVAQSEGSDPLEDMEWREEEEALLAIVSGGMSRQAPF